MVIGRNHFVTLKEDTHQYFDTNGREYMSVSSLLKKVEVPFDRLTISMRKAKSNLSVGASMTDLLSEQNRILKEWDDLRDKAAAYGTAIHENMEAYFTIGTCNDLRILPAAKSLGNYLKNSDRFFPEEVVYSEEYGIAGTADLPVARKLGKKGSTTILDLYDFKTNQRRGIEFDSSYIKDGLYHSGGKFYLPPLDHLEDCNYNKYALQLSVYALMFKMLYGLNIGRLGIIFIAPDKMPIIYPVPFMMYEAMQLFELMNQIKSLP